MKPGQSINRGEVVMVDDPKNSVTPTKYFNTEIKINLRIPANSTTETMQTITNLFKPYEILGILNISIVDSHLRRFTENKD